MSSNEKQKIQHDESFSPGTNLTSSSSSVLIPEDIIREYIVPYMAHLKQVDDVVKQFEKGVAETETIEEILEKCAKRGELSGVHYICSKYSNNLTNDGINFGFIGACRYGYLTVVRYFCELKDDEGRYRCNPSFYDNEAIREAARFGHLNIIQYLCEIKNHDGTHRCDPSDEDNDAIRFAQCRGDLDIVNYLRGLKNNDGTLRCPMT